jgi:hypothetical protein
MVRGYSKQFIMKLTGLVSPASDCERVHQNQSVNQLPTEQCNMLKQAVGTLIVHHFMYSWVLEIERVVEQQISYLSQNAHAHS